MPETLLTPSSIKLFGRVMSSLQYADDTTGGHNPGTVGNNNFLQRQLSYQALRVSTPVEGTTILHHREVILNNYYESVKLGMVVTGNVPVNGGPAQDAFLPGTHIVAITDPGAPAAAAVAGPPPIAARAARPTRFEISIDPLQAGVDFAITLWVLGVNLARIYAFSFEGAVYSIPRPALFIVHGLGTPLDPDHWFGGPRALGNARSRGGSTGHLGERSDMDQSGVAAREWEFSGDASLVYWEYERSDFSIRFDTEAGPFEEILLAAALRIGADSADRSGAGGVQSGAHLSGAHLSGAHLSGAHLRNR